MGALRTVRAKRAAGPPADGDCGAAKRDGKRTAMSFVLNWFIVVLASAAMEHTGIDLRLRGAVNTGVQLHDHMWSVGKKMYDHVHHQRKRPGTNTVCDAVTPTIVSAYQVPSTSVSSTYTPVTNLVKLASLKCVVPLWPSYRKEERGKVVLRFVPL